jgi:hypothetical protein
MPGTAVGISMNYGYPGTYSRNDPSLHIANRIVNPTDTENILFGEAVSLIMNSVGGYHTSVKGFIAAGGSFTYLSDGVSAFAGIAVREVKSFEAYVPSPTYNYYAPGSPCDVLEQGNVSVQLNNPKGAAVVCGGPVFIRIALDASYPQAQIGDIEAAADGANTVQLMNCMITTGLIDGNGVGEITILNRNVP